jgi:hypothetical protein
MSRASHVARVKTLYRNVLKHQNAWCSTLYVKTDPWPEHAQYIRHRFEINRFLVTPEDQEAATQAGEQWVKDNYHPDLYCHVRDWNGIEFQRNEPLPLDVCDPRACGNLV